MIIEQLYPILSQIKGCTFASIDAETKENGIRKVTKNELAILFTNKTGSGYERMVKRRLSEIGKDPESFVVGDLPWGERIPDTPIIKHRGFYYLQVIQLRPGEREYFLGSQRLDPLIISQFGIRERRPTSQGLPDDKAVVCHTYAVEHIKGIRVLGETLPKDRERKKILGLKF